MRPIDADAIKLPKGFFEEVDNVPKFYEWLNEQPTIEPKRGKCTDESRYFHCSVCDYGVQDVFEGSGKRGAKTTYVFEKGGEWRYCPNCGAKMR